MPAVEAERPFPARMGPKGAAIWKRYGEVVTADDPSDRHSNCITHT